MRNRLFLSIFIVFLSTVSAVGGTIQRQYDFQSPELTYDNGRIEVILDGCRTTGLPGQPALPHFGAKLLLPPGEAIIEVKIISSEPVVFNTGVILDPVLDLYPLSFPGPIPPTVPNPEIYGADEPFPSDLIENVQTHYHLVPGAIPPTKWRNLLLQAYHCRSHHRAEPSLAGRL